MADLRSALYVALIVPVTAIQIANLIILILPSDQIPGLLELFFL